VGDGSGSVVGAGAVDLGLDGLDVFVTGAGSRVAGSLWGDGVVALGVGVGLVVAPGVRPATRGESLPVSGSDAMRSAVAESPRVNVNTLAVAMVATTALTTILCSLLIRMGVLLAVMQVVTGSVGGVTDIRETAYRSPARHPNRPAIAGRSAGSGSFAP
jgi:hypothetical protein